MVIFFLICVDIWFKYWSIDKMNVLWSKWTAWYHPWPLPVQWAFKLNNYQIRWLARQSCQPPLKPLKRCKIPLIPLKSKVFSKVFEVFSKVFKGFSKVFSVYLYVLFLLFTSFMIDILSPKGHLIAFKHQISFFYCIFVVI